MKKARFRKFIILAAVLIPLLTSAQYDIGVKANYGVSQINLPESSTTHVKAVYFQPSGQGGIFFNFDAW